MIMAQAELTQTDGGKISHKKLIGSGNFGDVYKVKHKDWGEVALKEMKFFENTSKREKQSMEKEAKVLFTLHCEHIVLQYGIIQEQECYGLVMELMHHGSMKHFLHEYEVPWAMIVSMIHNIILGMNYLHTTAKVVHRDLKIENVLVNKSFEAKVSDFGLAVCNKLSTRYSKKSSSHGPVGTICHIAPESLKDINKKPTNEFDVFSFAITLWEIFTLETPYENACNAAHITHCVIQGNRPSLEDFPGDCPKFLLKIMQDCWNGEPSERPTFCELKEVVEKELSEKYEKTGEVSKARENLHRQVGEKTRGSQPDEADEVDQVTSRLSEVKVQDDLATDAVPTDDSDNRHIHARDHYPRPLPTNVTSSIPETHRVSQEESSSGASPDQSNGDGQEKKYKPRYPAKIVTERILLSVSMKLQGDWKAVAGYLKIPQHEIGAIAIDHAAYGVQEQACQMLNKWHQRNGRGATHGALAVALNEAKKNNIVEML